MPVWPEVEVVPQLLPCLPPLIREFRHKGPLDFSFQTFEALEHLKVIEFTEAAAQTSLSRNF